MRTMRLLLIMILATMLQITACSRSDTWYIYIGGKPIEHWAEAHKTVAEKWGVKTEYFFGDCGGTYDYKSEEFDRRNQALFELLEKKYGPDWHETFEEQVDEEIRAIRKRSE